MTGSAIAFVAFVLTVNLTFLLYRAWTARRESGRIYRRIVRQEDTKVSSRNGSREPALIREDERGRGSVGKIAGGAWLVARLHPILEAAAIRTRPERVLRRCLVLAVGTALAVAVCAHGYYSFAAIPAGIAAGFLPVLLIRRRAKKRIDQFEEQFPDALEFISRSMRAGHALSISIEMLCQEFRDPLASDFRRMFEEHNLGMPLEAALGKLEARVPLVDVQFFVSAVLLQRQTGGNLAEILDCLARMIRERYELRAKIRAVSAHGRITGQALAAIPVFVGIVMCLVNRYYFVFFTTTSAGAAMVGISFGLQVVGYAVINQIVKIEV